MKQLIAVLLILCARPLSAGETAAAGQPPNIILILADDLSAKELTCYGNTEFRTPNLDRMAAEGTRFETFFSMPLCTPTRVALMTGQYGFHNGFLGMQNPAFRPQAKSPLHDIGNHFTHADLLKSRGYVTALAGKWQLSGELPTQIHDAGFDDYRMWAFTHNLPPGVTHPAKEKADKEGSTSRYWQPCIVENGSYLPTTPDDFGPDLFNDYVIDFAHRHRSEPFFIYYPSVLTHKPRVETPDPTRSGEPGARWPAGLKSSLEYLDHLMGKLFAALKADGLDENTLVIFLGDNGTGEDDRSKTKAKGSMTELGARTPCIIRGPGVRRGVVSRAVADLTDILPTLADFSGAELPKDRIFDGYSLAPVLRGEKEKHRDWIYSHLDDGRVLRDSRWLLEIQKDGKGEKFFDCGESRDGTGYKDVTASTDPEVQVARTRFAAILATIPEPKPDDATPQAKVEAKTKKVEARKKKKTSDQ
jgi:arylsulfatase A